MPSKPLPFTPTKHPPVEAQEAASLVLLRGSKDAPEVLLGKRRHDLRFMPGYAVFPGGRVDIQDKQTAQIILNSDEFDHDVLSGIKDTLSNMDWLAHSLAACRECLEETGLLIHQVGLKTYVGNHPYLSACGNTDRSSIDFPLPCIAQAITPESSSIRFNARFFYAANAQLSEHCEAEGELHSIGWYDAKEALDALALADVTEFVLTEAIKCYRQEVIPSIPPLLTYELHSEAVIIERTPYF